MRYTFTVPATITLDILAESPAAARTEAIRMLERLDAISIDNRTSGVEDVELDYTTSELLLIRTEEE